MIEFKGEDFFGSGVDLFVNKHIKELDYNDKVGRHTHDFAEIAYVYSGSGKNIAGGRSYPISRGSLIFMNYGEIHQIVVEETLVQIDILLSSRFISREIVSCDNFLDILTLSEYSELREFTDSKIPCMSLSGREMIFVESVFDRIAEEFDAKEVGWESVIRGCLQVVISIMIRHLGGSTSGEPHDPRIPREILEFIDRNYNERLTADMLSEKCFYNPAYFGRMFRECYGMSFKDYIKKRRINEAVRLLTGTELPIDEISRKVGYTNRTDFYRVFAEQTSRTPAEVRQNPESVDPSTFMVFPEPQKTSGTTDGPDLSTRIDGTKPFRKK